MKDRFGGHNDQGTVEIVQSTRIRRVIEKIEKKV